MLRKTAVLCTPLLLCVMLTSSAQGGAGSFVLGYWLAESQNTGQSTQTTSAVVNQTTATPNADLLYQVPMETMARVKNPLSIKSVSHWWNFDASAGSQGVSNKSLDQLFSMIVSDTTKLTLLQIRRVIDGRAPHSATLWFAYTDRANITPLDSLPPSKAPSPKKGK